MRQVEQLRGDVAADRYVEEAREIMAAMVRKYPDDVFANLRYLFYYREQGHRWIDEMISKIEAATAPLVRSKKN